MGGISSMAVGLESWQWVQLSIITISATLGTYSEIRLIAAEHDKMVAAGGFTFGTPFTGMGAIIFGGLAAAICGLFDLIIG
jgi:hypothetical protein